MGEARRRAMSITEGNPSNEELRATRERLYIANGYRGPHAIAAEVKAGERKETRRLCLDMAGVMKGSRLAAELLKQLRHRDSSGDMLARQFLEDVEDLSGGTASACRRRVQEWLAHYEVLLPYNCDSSTVLDKLGRAYGVTL